MKTSSFAILLAAICVLVGGCATSGPEYKNGAFHKFVAGLGNDNPLRQGVIDNRNDYPVTVRIDYPDGDCTDVETKKIPAKCFTMPVLARANTKARFTVSGGPKTTVSYMAIPSSPIGRRFTMPGRKTIHTGWAFPVPIVRATQ